MNFYRAVRTKTKFTAQCALQNANRNAKRKTLVEKKGRIILNVTVTKNFISFITQNFCQADDDVADVDKNYYYKFDLITLVTFVCCTTVFRVRCLLSVLYFTSWETTAPRLKGD